MDDGRSPPGLAAVNFGPLSSGEIRGELHDPDMAGARTAFKLRTEFEPKGDQPKAIESLVRGLNEAGSTIIVVTHTMWVVAEYAHRAVVVRDGRISQQGTVREVFAEEDELHDAALRPPHIVSLGNALGYPVLSVGEMIELTEENA